MLAARVAAPGLQLLQLLRDVYQTWRAISLQQAAAACLAAQESLGNATPCPWLLQPSLVVAA
jgi:hypothetical protein